MAIDHKNIHKIKNIKHDMIFFNSHSMYIYDCNFFSNIAPLSIPHNT